MGAFRTGIIAPKRKQTVTSMGSASRYWRFVRIDAAGGRKVKTLTPAKTFFLQQFASPTYQLKLAEDDIQRQLLAWSNGSTWENEPPPTVEQQTFATTCLRCFISNIVEQVCVQLETQFGIKHGFSRYDLFPFVLNDVDPDLAPNLRRESSINISPTNVSKDPDLSPKGKAFRPLALEIIETFQPDRGSLSTWTVRLVRRQRTLNSYLLECGVYLISDWAILNDTSLPQVQRVLSEFHNLTEIEVTSARLLLEAYHAVYRFDRLEQRRLGHNSRCLQPTQSQLDRIRVRMAAICPPEQSERVAAIPTNRLLGQLQTLAEQLRQYRIYARGGPAPADSLDRTFESRGSIPIASPQQQEEENVEQSEFLAFYRQQFLQCLDMAIAATIDRWVDKLARKKSPKHESFLKALVLFHGQGISMGDIAPQIGLKAQYQVSRLLKLKELRADIRQHLAVSLRDRIQAKLSTHHHLNQLQELDTNIDAALAEQIDSLFQEAAAEASIAQHRPARSLYARRLCHYLDSRSTNS